MTSNSTDEDSYDSSSCSENNYSTVKKEHRKCKFCGKQSPTAAKSKIHEASCEHIRNVEICVLANGKTKFLCKICNQSFKYITGLTRHEKRHEPPGGFICRLCNSAFTTDAERNTHKEQTHRLYKCQICEEHFTEDQSYIDHIQNVHDGKDREYVICTVCGQTFRTAAQLKNHNDSKCGTEKSFGCDVCDSKFMTQNTLNAHKLIHSGEKKHLCNYCGNSFLSKGQLKVHERSHTHEKPFKCEVCGKAFSYRESLVTHSSLHTGIKPYFCECCSSRFSCIGNLIKHRKARPDSCGQPQYCKNSKIAPRASAKNPGSLTMKIPKTMPKTPRGPYKKKKQEKIFSIHEIKTENNSVIADELIIPDSKNTLEINPNPDDNKAFIIDYIEEKIIEESKAEIPQTTTNQQFEEFTETEYVTQPVFNFVPANNDNYTWNQTDTIVFEPEQTYEDNPFDDADDETIFSNDDEKQPNDNSDNFITAELVNVKMETDNEEGECSPSVKLKNSNTNSGGDRKRRRKESRCNDKRGKENSSDEEDDYRKVVYEYESSIRKKPSRNRKKIQQTNSSESDGDEIDSENDPDFVPITNKRTSPKKSNENLTEEDMDEKHFNDIIYFDNGEDDLLTVQYNVNKDGDDEVDANSTEDFFECSMCPKRYKHKSGVHKHIRSEHATEETKKPVKKDKAQFQCKFCNKKYLSLLLLEKHQRVHGSEGTLIHKCSCCKLYFATILEVEAHQLKEHEDKLVCSVCHKAFKEPDNLQAHFRYAHNKGVPSPKKYMYMCPSCGKNFSSKVALSDHERSNCGRSPLYKCESCEKAFHSAGSLKTHQTVHTGELPHLCNYCGKGFRTVGQVKVHERRHNGDKPFKCEYCPKAFGYRESLLTHRSLHTGMKRFMCHACGARFSCISNLQAHRKSHKNTCGLQPNYTKSVGPMGALDAELASSTATSTEIGFVQE